MLWYPLLRIPHHSPNHSSVITGPNIVCLASCSSLRSIPNMIVFVCVAAAFLAGFYAKTLLRFAVTMAVNLILAPRHRLLSQLRRPRVI